MPKLLQFLPKSHSLLRQRIKPITDFNDPLLHEIIADMCHSILPDQLMAACGVHKSAAGMAANQWGIDRRVFLYTPDGSKAGNRLEVMLNPSYLPYLRHGETQPSREGAYEGCFSVPLTTGWVERFVAIIATYYTPKGKKVEQVMTGWEARVFQHETDHLDGKLFDGALDGFKGPVCDDRIIFKDADEMEKFWQQSVRPSRE